MCSNERLYSKWLIGDEITYIYIATKKKITKINVESYMYCVVSSSLHDNIVGGNELLYRTRWPVVCNLYTIIYYTTIKLVILLIILPTHRIRGYLSNWIFGKQLETDVRKKTWHCSDTIYRKLCDVKTTQC